MQQSKNVVKVSTLYTFLCIMCISIHAFYTIFFIAVKLMPLSVLNFMSVLIYITLFVLIKNDKYALVTCLCCVEITINAYLSSMFLGWETGFYFYFFALVPLSFYCRFKKKQIKFIMCAWIVIEFIFTYITSENLKALYSLDKYSLLFVFLLNAFSCFFVLVFLSYFYTKTIIYEASMLSEKNQKLQVLANTDPLTGLLNRRSMMKKLDQVSESYESCEFDYSLILIDIDEFKKLNDRFGHKCGDIALVSISEAICNILRKDDVVCRWGGEEILILLPQTKIDAAEHVAEKLRRHIQRIELNFDGEICSMTITLGVCGTEGECSVSEMINRADMCMYKGKAAGKNCVVSYREIMEHK